MIELFKISFSKYGSEANRPTSYASLDHASPIRSADDFESDVPYALMLARTPEPVLQMNQKGAFSSRRLQIPSEVALSQAKRNGRKREKRQALNACYISYLDGLLDGCDRAMLILVDTEDEISKFPADAAQLVYDSTGELENIYGKALIPSTDFRMGRSESTRDETHSYYTGPLPRTYLDYIAQRDFYAASRGSRLCRVLGLSDSRCLPDDFDAISLLSHGRFSTPDELLISNRRPYNALMDSLSYDIDKESSTSQLANLEPSLLTRMLNTMIKVWEMAQDSAGIGFHFDDSHFGERLDFGHMKRAAKLLDEVLGVSDMLDAYLAGVPLDLLETPHS